MQQSATDPDTGAIDMDIIQTGVSASKRRDREALGNEIAQLLLSERLTYGPVAVHAFQQFLVTPSRPRLTMLLRHIKVYRL